MAEQTVNSKCSDANAHDGIIEFPQNRTLYIDQFTDEAPDSDMEREAFMPRKMTDVFDHYQPCKKNIVLKTEGGGLEFEDFAFRSIEDFEDERLIEQSKLLSKQKTKTKELLVDNLHVIHHAVKKLELAYCTLDAFFSNAGQGAGDCLTLMNVNKEKLRNQDSEDTLSVREELERYYGKLSLEKNYSLLVLPGYLGNMENVRMWARIVYSYRVIMVTDFIDCDNFGNLFQKLEDEKVQGQAIELSNVVMTCNYLLGRKKSELAKEDEDLYLPGSAALAGRMTNTDEIVIAQGAAGKKYGTLSNVKGTRLDLRNAQIAELMDQGVIPMVEKDGRTMAFSNRSLYNGATLSLQEYPIVRTFDWIGKKIQNIFENFAFFSWDSMVKADICKSIQDFMDEYKSPGKLIESYRFRKLERDSISKNFYLMLEIKLISFSNFCLFELTCQNDSMGEYSWEQVISNV